MALSLSSAALRVIDRLVLSLELEHAQIQRAPPPLRGSISFKKVSADVPQSQYLSQQAAIRCLYGPAQGRAVKVLPLGFDATQGPVSDDLDWFISHVRKHSAEIDWPRLLRPFENLDNVMSLIDLEHAHSLHLTDERCAELINAFDSWVQLNGGSAARYFTFQACSLIALPTNVARDPALFRFARPSLLRRILGFYRAQIRAYEPRRVMFLRLMKIIQASKVRERKRQEEEEGLESKTNIAFIHIPDDSFSKLSGLVRGEADLDRDVRVKFLLNEAAYKPLTFARPANLTERKFLVVEFTELAAFAVDLLERSESFKKVIFANLISDLYVQFFVSGTVNVREHDFMDAYFAEILKLMKHINNALRSTQQEQQQAQAQEAKADKTVAQIFAQIVKNLEEMAHTFQMDVEQRTRVDEQASAEAEQKVQTRQKRVVTEYHKANFVVEHEAGQDIVDFFLEKGGIIALIADRFEDNLIQILVKAFKIPRHKDPKRESITRLFSLMSHDFLTFWLRAHGKDYTSFLLENYMNYTNAFFIQKASES